MVYLVATRDGQVHSTFDEVRYIAWLDMFGPEVVHTAKIDDQGNSVIDEALPCAKHKIRNCVRCYGL